MNQYLFLRRMRGPIILLTFGITAILDEYAGIRTRTAGRCTSSCGGC